jgi:hypothetical protein
MRLSPIPITRADANTIGQRQLLFTVSMST